MSLKKNKSTWKKKIRLNLVIEFLHHFAHFWSYFNPFFLYSTHFISLKSFLLTEPINNSFFFSTKNPTQTCNNQFNIFLMILSIMQYFSNNLRRFGRNWMIVRLLIHPQNRNRQAIEVLWNIFHYKHTHKIFCSCQIKNQKKVKIWSRKKKYNKMKFLFWHRNYFFFKISKRNFCFDIANIFFFQNINKLIFVISRKRFVLLSWEYEKKYTKNQKWKGGNDNKRYLHEKNDDKRTYRRKKQFKKTFYKNQWSCDRKYWCDFLWLLLTINRFILIVNNMMEDKKKVRENTKKKKLKIIPSLTIF